MNKMITVCVILKLLKHSSHFAPKNILIKNNNVNKLLYVLIESIISNFRNL